MMHLNDLQKLEMRPRLMLAVAAGWWVGSAGATIDGPARGDNRLDAAAETSSHERK
jgi:hypothetical protein